MLERIAYEVEQALLKIYKKEGLNPFGDKFGDDRFTVKIYYKFEGPYTNGLVTQTISEASGRCREAYYVVKDALEPIFKGIRESPTHRMGLVRRSCYIVRVITSYGCYETTIWA